MPYMILCIRRECLSLCFWCDRTEIRLPFLITPMSVMKTRRRISDAAKRIRKAVYSHERYIRYARNVSLWCGYSRQFSQDREWRRSPVLKPSLYLFYIHNQLTDRHSEADIDRRSGIAWRENRKAVLFIWEISPIRLMAGWLTLNQ